MKEEDIGFNETNKEEIIFSYLKNGFRPNPHYKSSEQAFDVRANREVQNNIFKNKSFLSEIKYKDKEYVVLGLSFNMNSPEVRNLIMNSYSTGRDGYIFGVIDKSKLEDIDRLEEETINSAKRVFPLIKNWKDAIEPLSKEDFDKIKNKRGNDSLEKRINLLLGLFFLLASFIFLPFSLTGFTIFNSSIKLTLLSGILFFVALLEFYFYVKLK